MPLDRDLPEAVGMVLTDDRGSLPFALVHGEALAAAAVWALSESGVTPTDPDTGWDELVDLEEPVVLHDSLCPMTPPEFLADCLERSVGSGAVVVGVRPVTDTIKNVVDGVVGATVDRTALVRVTSPIVLPATVVASLEGPPSGDFAAAVHALAQRFPVTYLEAPPEGRRVDDAHEISLLEALTRP